VKYTVVKCMNCKTILYKEDFNKERITKSCECGEITVSTQIIENSIYPWYVTVSHTGARPDIYETNERG